MVNRGIGLTSSLFEEGGNFSVTRKFRALLEGAGQLSRDRRHRADRNPSRDFWSSDRQAFELRHKAGGKILREGGQQNSVIRTL